LWSSSAGSQRSFSKFLLGNNYFSMCHLMFLCGHAGTRDILTWLFWCGRKKWYFDNSSYSFIC
jgi:hypothetical protein